MLDFWNVNLRNYYKLEKKKLNSKQTWFLVEFELDFYCLCSLQKSISKSNWFFNFLNSIFRNWKKIEWHSIFQKSSGDRQGECALKVRSCLLITIESAHYRLYFLTWHLVALCIVVEHPIFMMPQNVFWRLTNNLPKSGRKCPKKAKMAKTDKNIFFFLPNTSSLCIVVEHPIFMMPQNVFWRLSNNLPDNTF